MVVNLFSCNSNAQPQAFYCIGLTTNYQRPTTCISISQQLFKNWFSMNKLIMILAVAIMAASCSSPKYFRKLNTTEAAEVRAAQKQWGKSTDAYRVLIMTDS